MSKLEELGDFLGEKMNQLKSLQVKSPTLAELRAEIEEELEGKDVSQRQHDQYTIAKLSGKIVELEAIIQKKG
jgi:hypothetical protein